MREDSRDHGSGEARDARDDSPGATGGPAPPSDTPSGPAFWEQGIEAAPPPLPAVRGLFTWFALILMFGGGGLLIGQQEMAALTAIGGLFVAAHAADLDRRWRGFYLLVAWVAPLGGAVLLAAVGVIALQGGLSSPARLAAAGVAFAGSALSLASLLRPVGNGLASLLFRTPDPSHVLRLSSRLIMIGFLVALPGWFVFRDVFDTLFTDPTALFEHVTLGGGLVGYVLLALASVGLMVRRNLKATLERLGITPINAAQMAVVAGGVVALFALNVAADWAQRTFFPALWESDHAVNQAIASGLTVGQVLMLGLSAGVGEEITLRGALQPRLGVLLTALLFASLHVQYSWFGILVIFALGLILGAIRARTSTSVAIAIHTLYDVAAVFSV